MKRTFIAVLLAALAAAACATEDSAATGASDPGTKHERFVLPPAPVGG
jgi:ABC-type glycerol-3-phosphate transport system substrate-binding protein